MRYPRTFGRGRPAVYNSVRLGVAVGRVYIIIPYPSRVRDTRVGRSVRPHADRRRSRRRLHAAAVVVVVVRVRRGRYQARSMQSSTRSRCDRSTVVKNAILIR